MADKFPLQFGEYRLLRKIAQGGMAEIFLAQDKQGNVCAIKRILPHLAHEESFIRMFIDEARIVSHLDHPNVSCVYGQGKHDGFYYIAMEFVEGHSILALQERAKSQKMALPRGLLAYVVAEFLNGLGHAHAARDHRGRFLGIVHRDVTPQNVLISYDGEVKLIDFGVAKAKARLTQTDAGFTKGKLAYMSPEQARGDELDGRSDLFSVGIILYEITTGRRLFNKEGPGGILGAIVNDEVTPPTYKDRKYPRDLEAIVMRALEKDRKARWQSAEEMSEALKRYSRRERPAPGSDRLKNLIYDLFGEAKYRSVIDEARSSMGATPSAGTLQIDSSSEINAARSRKPTTDGRGQNLAEMQPEETRMMGLPEALNAESMAMKSALVESRRSITGEGVPDLDAARDPEELSIPEPKTPRRVRLARLLTAFAQDVKESYQAHPWRYRISGVASCVAGLVLVLYSVGVFGKLGTAVEDAVEGARRIKNSAGLGEISMDSGLRSTLLRVKSDPPGALVSVNQIGAGCVTPCDLPDLQIGKRLVVAVKQTGFRMAEEVLTLKGNQGVQEIELILEREVGRIDFDSIPKGAAVFIDGIRVVKATPVSEGDLSVLRPLKIEFKKAGYFSQIKTIRLKDRETKMLIVKLKRDPGTIKPGKIHIKSVPPNCLIFVGRREIGRSPITHSAKPGTYTVTAKCENHETDLRTVYVESKKTKRIRFEPTPNVFGYLTLSVKPAKGTVVEINGRIIPLPISFKKVVPGRHEVTVENKNLRRKKTMSIKIRPNKRVTRVIDLFR